MIIGYSITGYDNDSFMCSSADEVLQDMDGLAVCPKCGYRTDFFYINSHFRASRRTYDLSSTYDGYTIVSRKFKEFCQRRGYEKLDFKGFEADPDFFALMSATIVEFDSDRSKPRFEDYCDACGNYESIVGPSPIYLKDISTPLADSFYRTDLLFASGNEKHPLIIIGPDTKAAILCEGFKNIDFEEIVA